jgi:sugar lactone lactonase YvrE
MKCVFKLLLSCLIGLSVIPSYAQKLEKKWATDTLLRVPESVLYDGEKKILYVANIDGKPDGKDGVGFISKVSLNGKIENLKWVTGLDAPKGLGLFKGTLYVADVNQVVAIDIASGKITNRVVIDGAVFLNDITVDKKGIVYVSDTGTGKIHAIKDGKSELYLESKELQGVNGLLALNDGLYVVDFANGFNYKLGADKKLMKTATTAQGADGVVPVGNGDYIVSSWHGEVQYVNAQGQATQLLDTKAQKINAADIDYDPATKTLYIPTFFANSVVAYELKK